MAVICRYCSVSVLTDPELFARGLAALPWADRREKVMRYRFDRDRRSCLGAGLLAAFSLRAAGADRLDMIYGPNGKPALTGCPGIHFNISHSGDLAVCAVSDEPVGVDVELKREAVPEVARACFQEREMQWMENAPDPSRAFYRLWTRKESLLKLLGTGLSRPMDSFSVLEEGQDLAFAETEANGHLICVCTGKGQRVDFVRWRLTV